MDGSVTPAKRTKSLQPFLKWAGGKRWLANFHGHLFPDVFANYVEPFLGSGAIFFSLMPSRSRLSDVNEELVETYRAIRGNWRLVLEHLRVHERLHCDEHYYYVRSSRPRVPHTRAARFLYLNRTCWNGLYRVNKDGQFNVPKGTKDAVLMPTDDFEAWSNALAHSAIKCRDFEESIDESGSGDFLFCDPPYTVSSAQRDSGFLKYSPQVFSWQDQIRLRDALVRFDKRGGKFMLTNALHKSVRELYGDFFCIEVDRPSVISGSNVGRGRMGELIVRNYT